MNLLKNKAIRLISRTMPVVLFLSGLVQATPEESVTRYQERLKEEWKQKNPEPVNPCGSMQNSDCFSKHPDYFKLYNAHWQRWLAAENKIRWQSVIDTKPTLPEDVSIIFDRISTSCSEHINQSKKISVSFRVLNFKKFGDRIVFLIAEKRLDPNGIFVSPDTSNPNDCVTWLRPENEIADQLTSEIVWGVYSQDNNLLFNLERVRPIGWWRPKGANGQYLAFQQFIYHEHSGEYNFVLRDNSGQEAAKVFNGWQYVNEEQDWMTDKTYFCEPDISQPGIVGFKCDADVKNEEKAPAPLYCWTNGMLIPCPR